MGLMVRMQGNKKAFHFFSSLYASHFIFLGLLLPFFSGWLALKGFSASDIGLINGIALVARLIVGPAVAVFADQQEDKRKVLVFVSFIFSLCTLVLNIFESHWIIAISSALIIWCFGLLVPITDSIVLRADRAGFVQYGKVRAVGSFAFLATTLLGGIIIEAGGLKVVTIIMGLSSLGALGVAIILPAFITSARTRSDDDKNQYIANNQDPSDYTDLHIKPKQKIWQEAGQLVVNPVFLVALLAAGFTQGAHAVYYAYSILDWSDQGYSAQLIGWLWAIGVMAEIFLLYKARALAKKLGPVNLLILGAIAAAIRWFIISLQPPFIILCFAQILHAFTFGAAYLGSVEFIDRAIPPRLINTGMVLFSTTGVGAITGLATVIAGYVFEFQGASAAYLMMTIMGMMALVSCLWLRFNWSVDQLIK